jgi:hypothetical protein
VRTHCYHLDQQGSYSIKAVLPTVVPELDYAGLDEVGDGGGAQRAHLEPIDATTDEARRAGLRASEAAQVRDAFGYSPRQAAYRAWWKPVLEAPLDDPDQEPPKLYWPNNVRAALPWQGTWVLAYALDGGKGRSAVCLAGRKGPYAAMMQALDPQREELLAELPPGSTYEQFNDSDENTYICRRRAHEFPDEDERRKWLSATLNAFVNVFRPRLKELVDTNQS